MSASRRPEPQPRLRLVTRALDLDEVRSFAPSLSPALRRVVDEVTLAAAGPVQPMELSGELRARLTFRTARAGWTTEAPHRRSSRGRHLSPIAVAAVSATGLLAGVAGLSAAAVLPPPSHALDQVLHRLGLGAGPPQVHAPVSPVGAPASSAAAPPTAVRPEPAAACPSAPHPLVGAVHLGHGCATAAPAVTPTGGTPAAVSGGTGAPAGTASVGRGTGGRVSTIGHARAGGGPSGTRPPASNVPRPVSGRAGGGQGGAGQGGGGRGPNQGGGQGGGGKHGQGGHGGGGQGGGGKHGHGGHGQGGGNQGGGGQPAGNQPGSVG